MPDQLDVEDSTPRKLLVSGASSGIGKAICARLLSGGHHVIGLSRRVDQAIFTQQRFTPIHVDLSHIDALPERIEEIAATHPDIGGIVCCAGQGRFGSLEEFSYQQIRQLMDINFLSHCYLVRGLLPMLKQRGRGDIIFIGSDAALAGAPRGTIYCASKFALRGFAQALRGECARRGIRVSLINPGMVETAFYDDLSFRPGLEEENYLIPKDIADAVALVLNARPGTVFNEINLSPLKKVIKSRDKE